MRMSDEDFTRKVLARGNELYRARQKQISLRVKSGIFVGLIAVFFSPFAIRFVIDRSNQAIVQETADMDFRPEESSEAACAEEAADEAAAEAVNGEAESGADLYTAGESPVMTRPSALQASSAEKSSDTAEQERIPEDALTAGTESESFVSMTESELLAYYGIPEMPQTLGTLQLQQDRSSGYFYHMYPEFGITFGDAACTVVKDDTNLWTYAPDGASQPVMFVYLNKAQDGAESEITYSDNGNGVLSAYYTTGSVFVYAEGLFMEQDAFEENMELLHTALHS